MGSGKQRIFIVNDDADVVEAIREVLTDAGYAVDGSATRDVGEVVAAAPDLLLVDSPPGEEKYVLNFIQRLRLHRTTATLPILLGTTSLRPVEPELLRERMILVLVRPFDIEDLLAAVRDLLHADSLKRAR
jgi:DNA-binding response OmpR family regulator